MAVKPYKIEEEENNPQMLAEPMAVYGSNAAYEYDDDVDVLDRENDEDVADDFDAAEWDEIEREGVMVGIEQLLKGKCYTQEEVFGNIRRRLGWY